MRREIAALCVCLLLAVQTGCSKKEELDATFPQELLKLAGKRIGILTGLVFWNGQIKAVPDV